MANVNTASKTINTSMLALREARKHYVRAPGTGMLVNGDRLALALAELNVEQIMFVCTQFLALESNPYAHLNRGQQSMNLRNKIRYAVLRGDVTVEEVERFRDVVAPVVPVVQ
jgi:hypothetical protein